LNLDRAKACLKEGNMDAYESLQQSQLDEVDDEIAQKEDEIRRLTKEVASLK